MPHAKVLHSEDMTCLANGRGLNDVGDDTMAWANTNHHHHSHNRQQANASMVFMQSQQNWTLEHMDISRAPDLGIALLLAFLTAMTVITILGNTLVILAVATTRRLRSVTNCFIVSLSVADLLVGCLVMPLSLIYEIVGIWPFGYAMCELWSSLDIMLCTASILNLCCISLDRYFAITRPLTYTVKRNKRLALGMIGVVWLASAAVTFPPLLGWYKRGVEETSHCQYVTDKGYVIYSACGSFYIPLLIMLFVYTRIFVVIYRRNRVVKQQKQYQKQQQQQHCTSNGCAVGGAAALHGKNGGRHRCVEYRKDSSLRELLRSSNSDCFVSIEMASDSLLTVRPRCDADPQSFKDPAGCGAGSKLYRSRSYQFHFQTPSGRSATVPIVNERKVSARVDTHLLAVPHWVPGLRSPSTSNSALNVSSTSARSLYTDSTFLCPPADHNQKAKLSLPSLGVPPKQASLLQTVPRSHGDYRRKHVRGLRMSFRKETKATTTIAVVVGGFVVCWMPFFIIYIVEPFCEACTFSPILHSSLTWLGWANSAVNPFIYAFYNMDFRAAFWKLTLGRCMKQTSKRNSVVLYPQVWRSRLKTGTGINGVPSIVMVQSDVM